MADNMEDLWHKTKTTFCFGLMAQDKLLILFFSSESKPSTLD